MIYISNTTQEVLTENELRQRFKSVILPRVLPNNVFEFSKVLTGAIPAAGTNEVVEQSGYEKVGDQWYYKWNVRALTEYSHPAAVVPAAVTMRQARLALHANGLLTAAVSAIDSLPEPQKTAAQIEWEYSSEVHRQSQMTNLIAAALGLSPQQIDELFQLAATL